MAKDKKPSAAAAAAEAQGAPEVKPTVKLPVDNNPNTKGMSQSDKVAYIGALQNERAFMMNNTEKPSQGTIDGLTMLAQVTILDVAISEIVSGNSVAGLIITANENNYNALMGMAIERGIKLPEFKMLPAPTEEQLKQAGVVGLLPTETRVVKIEKKDVSEKTIKSKKKEMESVAKAVSNPAEIKTPEQLKASLTAMLVKPISDGIDRPDARVQRTIKFYRGYLTIQANAAEDKTAAINEVKDKSRQKLLDEIAEIVGPCPFALTGTAYFLRKRSAETGSPISSFCLYRRSAVPEKDNTVDDQYVADIVRILLLWSCNSRIVECNEVIKEQKKHLENEKGSAKVATETAIRANETAIEELNLIITETTNPSFEVVDALIDNYKSDKTDSEEYKLAHRLVGNIIDTYYPEFKGKELDDETNEALLKNVQQRAGIIVNMFTDPLSQSINYKESNLVEVPVPEEKKD